MIIDFQPSSSTLYINVRYEHFSEFRDQVRNVFRKIEEMSEHLKDKLLDTDSQKLADPQERELVREKHRKKYMDKYRKEYKHRTKRVNITLTNNEHFAVEVAAGDQGKRVSAYVKDAVIEKATNVYLLPEDSVAEDLLLQIRSIGNNINQLTRHIHRSGAISMEHMAQLQGQLKRIEDMVVEKFTQPTNILEALQDGITSTPGFFAKLNQFMEEYKEGL